MNQPFLISLIQLRKSKPSIFFSRLMTLFADFPTFVIHLQLILSPFWQRRAKPGSCIHLDVSTVNLVSAKAIHYVLRCLCISRDGLTAPDVPNALPSFPDHAKHAFDWGKSGIALNTLHR